MSVAAEHPNSRTWEWAGRGLTALFALFMAMDIAMKLARASIVEQTQQQLGLQPASGFWIGLLEAVILVLYLVRRTSILGALFVAALMGGTSAVQLVAGKPFFSHVPFGPYLAVMAWAGLWLRDAKLRALLPLRRDAANGYSFLAVFSYVGTTNVINLPKRLIITALLALSLAAPAESRPLDCRVGTYRLVDGSEVDVRAIDDAHLRWQRKDGTSGKLTRVSGDRWSSTLGWTDRSDGKEISFDCSTASIDFAGVAGKRIEFRTIDTRFQGAGAELAGRLVMPVGTAKVPIVVLIHGSEHDSAIDLYALQRLFPSEGIAAFVYDKRGTGVSGGTYTQDFLTLADDAIAAVHEAKRLAGLRAGPVGYQAGSEGGWVAPLAAKIEPVDFLIVGFGLAISPLEEDREAMVLDMTSHGYGADVVAKALEVSNATAAVLLSNFRNGFAEVEAVKSKYGSEPWFKFARGDVSWVILQRSPEWLRETGPTLLPGIPLNHDPMPVLRNLRTRQLWILGEDDVDAPSAETARRLKELAATGRPITTVIFPGAEHGIYEYEVAQNGTRLSTRQPDGYFKMMCDFILNGVVGPRYGTARIARPKSVQDH